MLINLLTWPVLWFLINLCDMHDVRSFFKNKKRVFFLFCLIVEQFLISISVSQWYKSFINLSNICLLEKKYIGFYQIVDTFKQIVYASNIGNIYALDIFFCIVDTIHFTQIWRDGLPFYAHLRDLDLIYSSTQYTAHFTLFNWFFVNCTSYLDGWL